MLYTVDDERVDVTGMVRNPAATHYHRLSAAFLKSSESLQGWGYDQGYRRSRWRYRYIRLDDSAYFGRFMDRH